MIRSDGRRCSSRGLTRSQYLCLSEERPVHSLDQRRVQSATGRRAVVILIDMNTCDGTPTSARVTRYVICVSDCSSFNSHLSFFLLSFCGCFWNGRLTYLGDRIAKNTDSVSPAPGRLRVRRCIEARRVFANERVLEAPPNTNITSEAKEIFSILKNGKKR